MSVEDKEGGNNKMKDCCCDEAAPEIGVDPIQCQCHAKCQTAAKYSTTSCH